MLKMNERVEEKINCILEENSLVSIIIPAYNVEHTIFRTLQSVINQSYKKLEIIVVNDGSCDNTVKVCQEIIKNDQRIHLIHKKNGGLSEARNYGLDCATGEYIAFLDAGDMYVPEFVDIMMRKCQTLDVDMVICGYISVFENGTELYSSLPKKDIVLLEKEATIELIKGEIISSHAWNKLYKKKVFEKIRFPKGRVYEDIYIMPEVFSISKKTAIIKEHLVKYFQDPDSISHKKSFVNEKDAFNATILRYKRYQYIYPELLHYLVKEPIEIAIRVVLKEQRNKNLIQKEDLEPFINFINEKRKDIFSYKALKFKYKVGLFLFPVLKGVMELWKKKQ